MTPTPSGPSAESPTAQTVMVNGEWVTARQWRERYLAGVNPGHLPDQQVCYLIADCMAYREYAEAMKAHTADLQRQLGEARAKIEKVSDAILPYLLELAGKGRTGILSTDAVALLMADRTAAESRVRELREGMKSLIDVMSPVYEAMRASAVFSTDLTDEERMAICGIKVGLDKARAILTPEAT